MDKVIATLDNGTTCSAWNYSGQRMAAGSNDGTLSIYDLIHPDATTFHSTSRFKVSETSILKIVWVPPDYGDSVACICSDGTLSLWEEVVEDDNLLKWRICKRFDGISSEVLDAQFGVSPSLKLVAAFSDGQVKVFELLDPFDLANWQLQAEFQNVIESISKFAKPSCFSASISWDAQRRDYPHASFVLGFNSDIPQLNSPKICPCLLCSYSGTLLNAFLLKAYAVKVWEFDQDHQRWLPVAELASTEEKGDEVLAVAWSPNIGRPYEAIAVATLKGISIWHVGSTPNLDGRLPVERVAMLSGHNGEVWEMEWDESGMTLATVGSDGVGRLWQSNLNGIWKEQALLEPCF